MASIQKNVYRFLFMFSLAWGCSAEELYLPRPPVHLSVISSTADSGRRLAKITLDHPRNAEENDYFEVNLELTRVTCDMIHVEASISMPTSKNDQDVNEATRVPPQPPTTTTSPPPTTTNTPPPPPTKKPPPPGYTLIPNVGHYKLHTDIKNWNDAKLACEHEGTHLAIINSKTEHDELLKLFAKYPNIQSNSLYNRQAYLGANDIAKEKQWVTVLGTPLSGYTPWRIGEPNNGGGVEDCMTIFREGKVNDVPCDLKFAFFCEQQL